jgi:aminoacrylate hydrolase
MPRIAIGDCHLFYERQGAGFPVFFITGLGGFAGFWREQLPAFGRSFDVITHDHRGIGQSDHTKGGYTVERMARDVIGLMDALGVERAHVVGHSTGGAIAQILAIDHPDRLGAAVISASWTKSDPYFRRLFQLRKDILLRMGPEAYLQSATLFLYPPWWVSCNNERLRQLEAQNLAAMSAPEIIAQRIDAIVAFDRTAQLGRIRTPTLVVGAVDDVITPSYYSEELARRIPGAELKLFPKGGHCFTQVLARDFNNAVLPFLQAHTPREQAAPVAQRA